MIRNIILLSFIAILGAGCQSERQEIESNEFNWQEHASSPFMTMDNKMVRIINSSDGVFDMTLIDKTRDDIEQIVEIFENKKSIYKSNVSDLSKDANLSLFREFDIHPPYAELYPQYSYIVIQAKPGQPKWVLCKVKKSGKIILDIDKNGVNRISKLLANE
jgi:hypothetical protein